MQTQMVRRGVTRGCFWGSRSYLNNKCFALLINKRLAGLCKYADKPEVEWPGKLVRACGTPVLG
jgi:hypothetical protein